MAIPESQIKSSTPPHEHEWVKWERVKSAKKTERVYKRFCRVCWKLETKTERIDL